MKNVKVKAYTWAKDSHKLFDYESSNLCLSKALAAESLIIARCNNEVIFHDVSKGELPSTHTILCNLQKDSQDRFFLTSGNSALPLKLAIRNFKGTGKEQGCELRAGDKMQIGRVEYFVREVKSETGALTKADYGTQSKIDNEMDIEEEKEAKHCRICLEDEEIEDSDVQDIDKTFISPCRCKGTSKYVHVNCLKNWIKSKRQQKKPVIASSLPRLLVPNMNVSMYLSNPSNLNLFRFSEQLNGLSSPFPNLSLNRLPIPRGIFEQYQRFQMDIQRNLMNWTNTIANFDIILENGNPTANPIPEGEPIIDLDNPSSLNLNPPTIVTNLPETNTNPVTIPTTTATQTAQNSQENPAPRASDPSKIENHEFTNFSCDVCKDILPYVIKLNNSLEIETVNIPRPENMPYLVLERLSTGKEPKVISVLKGKDGQKIQMGRGHSCDIIIPDISVSRCHAFIKYSNGQFTIEDNNSKFGTLIELSGPVEIQNQDLAVQCGRTLVTVSTREQTISKEKNSPKMIVESTSQSDEKHAILYVSPKRRNKEAVRIGKISVEKRVQAEVKNPRLPEVRDGDSENTVDVEEIPASKVPELNSRSKKIGKRSKKK